MGIPILVTCERDAAKPSPQIFLLKNGREMQNTKTSNIIQYIDSNTNRDMLSLTYTCMARGGRINGSITSPAHTVTLLSK